MQHEAIGDRRGGEHDGDERETPRAHAEEAHGDEEDGGPDEIELLLDRERPRVVEASERMAEDAIPVRHVEHGRDDQLPHLAAAVQVDAEPRREQRGENRVGEQHEQRGQQAQCAPSVERAKVDVTEVAAFLGEDRRDEEAAEHEEERDAGDAAARDARYAKVCGHHEHDREAADAVECRPAAELPVRRPSLKGSAASRAVRRARRPRRDRSPSAVGSLPRRSTRSGRDPPRCRPRAGGS